MGTFIVSGCLAVRTTCLSTQALVYFTLLGHTIKPLSLASYSSPSCLSQCWASTCRRKEYCNASDKIILHIVCCFVIITCR